LFKHIRRNLRGSILTAFSALFFLSFALVGIAFNITVQQYIRHNAISELTETQELYTYFGGFTLIVRSGLFGQRINHFYLNENFYLLYGYTDPHILEIAETLMAEHITPDILTNRRLRTDGGIFYVTAKPAFGVDSGWFGVFYVDITDISRFSERVNMLLLVLVVIIWVVSMIIATFLAGSLAHPLRALNRFAQRIGRGNFTPNPESFANEEFETLNQSLNQTAKQLAKYDNDQKIFFQNVSHELRTPLMSVKSYAEGIKYGIMDAKKSSETIIESADRLTQMVGDILYISRIDNITTPDEEDVDLIALIAKRVNLHQDPMGKIQIGFRHDTEPVIIPCVKSYIERALDNLISNALRYAKTTILIECYGIGPRAVIRVLDDGPGFEPGELSSVFERFYRGKGGLSGIGLAIVKSIADQHDGIVTAENNENGAVLTLSVPRTMKIIR